MPKFSFVIPCYRSENTIEMVVDDCQSVAGFHLLTFFYSEFKDTARNLT